MSVWFRPVHVHRNLNRDVWSITRGGKVVGWEPAVLLVAVEFRVQPAGRRRARRERRKNVHAYAAGRMLCWGLAALEAYEAIQDQAEGYRGELVSYTPFGPVAAFQRAVDSAPVTLADFALFDPEGKLRTWGSR